MKLPSTTRIVLQGKVEVNRDWLIGFLIEMNNSETMEIHEIALDPLW